MSKFGLEDLDWAEADVPILPAVEARMRREFVSQRACDDIHIVTADWGKDPPKRAVYTAHRAGQWIIRRELPPSDGWNLTELINLACRLRRERHKAVLVGIDVVLGVPFTRGLRVAAALWTH